MQDATLPRPALLGIDLGTTNSLIAVWQDGQARLIPNALGDVLTPSVVSLDEDDTILVGNAARARLTTHPDRTAAAFKRFMGSDKQVQLGVRQFSPEELSALVLGSLKQDACAQKRPRRIGAFVQRLSACSDNVCAQVNQCCRAGFCVPLIGMRLAFASSGITRSRSMLSRPLLRSAALISM